MSVKTWTARTVCVSCFGVINIIIVHTSPLSFVANGVGASIGFCLPPLGRAVSAAGEGPAAVQRDLWVGYLRSYEHMGRARVRCSGEVDTTSVLIYYDYTILLSYY